MVYHKSAAAITNVIMAAACYPEAQIRVQEELDMVVGRDKSKYQCFNSHELPNRVTLVPTWEDYKCLPQVRAYVLETLGWRPVTPMGECLSDWVDDKTNSILL